MLIVIKANLVHEANAQEFDGHDRKEGEGDEVGLHRQACNNLTTKLDSYDQDQVDDES